jgi:enoyl-[acyl-carrier protein] reductase II
LNDVPAAAGLSLDSEKETPMTTIRTPLTDLLGIEHPVCLGPMGLISTPPLVAAVSSAGGLGIMGTAMFDAEGLREAIRQTRELTDRPFGVSLMAGMPTAQGLAEVAIDERVPFVTTSAGSPKRLAPLFREAGIENYHVVPSVKLALKAKAAGCTGVVAEGSEGASFKSLDEISTLVLIPQVIDATGLPVIGAGGFGDGRGLAAALCLGAVGIQMGTRFIATEESPIHENYKQVLLRLAETDTLMVGRKSGPLRVARNACSTEMAEFEKTTDDVAQLRSKIGYQRFPQAAVEGDVENGLLVAGQVVGMLTDLPSVKDLIPRIVAEAAETLARRRDAVSA